MTFVPTLRGQWLGHLMRELREERGLALREVAAYVGVDMSTLARYERSEWAFRPDHAAWLLNVYAVHDEQTRAEVTGLAEHSGCINWWRLDPAVTTGPPLRVRPFGVVDLPPPPIGWIYGRAERVCLYADTLVPELFQTRAYAHAAAAHVHGPHADARLSIDAAVDRLIDRQRLLTAGRPAPVEVLIAEHVLHRPIGGAQVLAAQLEHLYRQPLRRDVPVTVRVLPTSADAHAGVHGPYMVLHMRTGMPPVAFIDHLGGQLIVESVHADRYTAAHQQLWNAALTPTDSHTLLRNLTRPADRPTGTAALATTAP
ncbi:helix-turn-helix domain-containing protein [Phytohabitans rumicis]|nr:helix-turn-helix transcriptional regulator [Phytohabitans rumicis]